jgi:geranylgeranyl reductase family protein
VVVVGAGPAGSTCALKLARSGLGVAVVDKHPPPRYKACGGGLIGRARELAGVDLAGIVERECKAAEVNLLHARLRFRVERNEPLVSMTMRDRLDRRLLEAAIEAGAELIAPCELTGIESSGGERIVCTDGGTLRARYVVAADGALSRTAQAAGWERNLRGIPAIESEIRVDAASFERLRDCARFDFELLPHGYAWVFPKREHLSVGCLTTERGTRGLKQHLERYIALLDLSRIEERKDHGFVIPVAPRSRVLARDGVLLTGDAAGFADPVTCEGISHAMASGGLAAEAIGAHVSDPRRVEECYQRTVAREILSELRIARLLARVLYDRHRLRVAIFRRLGRPLCEAFAEIISGRASYRGVFCKPANYFKLFAWLSRGSFAAMQQ